jgi:hypothetical protein
MAKDWEKTLEGFSDEQRERLEAAAEANKERIDAAAKDSSNNTVQNGVDIGSLWFAVLRRREELGDDAPDTSEAEEKAEEDKENRPVGPMDQITRQESVEEQAIHNSGESVERPGGQSETVTAENVDEAAEGRSVENDEANTTAKDDEKSEDEESGEHNDKRKQARRQRKK